MFKLDAYSKHCSFVADCGFVTPLVYSDPDRAIEIKPVLDCDETLQNELFEHFAEHWHVETGAKSADDASKYIITQWSSTDIMYVMSVDGKFAGCVAVDRKNVEPCISHLTVVPGLRGKKMSLLLMEIAESYTHQCLQFTSICLWCHEDLIPYYVKQGYTKTGQLTETIVTMRKTFSNEGVAQTTSHNDMCSSFSKW